jgi:isopenicillin N synthase-like dioxygenase
MPYAQAIRTDRDLIPVIDITPLREGGDIARVARALHAANRGLGFVYIKGHGIPSATINRARDSAMEFFHSSDDDKSSVSISKKHRGWLAQGGAKMQDDARSDLKESYIWGWQDESGDTPDDHPVRGPNQWPKFIPELEKNAMEFFQHAHRVAHQLMRGFALGLGLEEKFFLQHCSRPLSRASFVYYPAQPESMGDTQFGVGPHTDFGLLTVLCQDSVGGLQVRDVNGDWIHAPPIDGTLLVNVGDLLSRWTDGAYKSTPHRVVNSSGKERLSLVLAFDPDPETMIDAKGIFGVDHVAKQAPISCGEYLVQRFARAFSYRNA